MITFESYHTVPLLLQRDMDPYMKIQDPTEHFPLPGEDFTYTSIDLSLALIKHPDFTFFVQASEESMCETGIRPGDILIIDKSLEPKNKSMILAYLEGEYVLRQVLIDDHGLTLIAEDPDITPVFVEPDMAFSIWGVVRDWLPSQD